MVVLLPSSWLPCLLWHQRRLRLLTLVVSTFTSLARWARKRWGQQSSSEPQRFTTVSGDRYTPTGLTPNACLWLTQPNQYGEWEQLEPAISGWGACEGIISDSESGVNIQIPASGSLADQIPLPDLPAGQYQMWFAAWPSVNGSTSVSLGVAFTIGADGTFSKIGPACGGREIHGECSPM